MNNGTSTQPMTIVIDAGHGGGVDAGGSTANGSEVQGMQEKTVTLEIGRRISEALGPNAIMTRSGDQNLTLRNRAAVAQQHNAVVFLSLHANAGENGARGGELYVHPRAAEASRRLAQALQAEASRIDPHSKPVQIAEMAVLAPELLPPDAAACLFEIDYLTNPDGRRRLTDPVLVQEISQSIVRGINLYLEGAPENGMPPHPPAGGGTVQALSGDDAQSVELIGDHTIIEIIEDTTAAVPPTAQGAGYPRAAGDTAAAVSAIVNVGQLAWEVMRDNRPVANATSDWANAIPEGSRLEDVTGWAAEPRRLRIRYHTESTLLSSDLEITVSWFYNGAWNGAGQYVNAATVVATGNVAFGQTVNITASINSPMNLGTEDAPIGALPVRISIQQSNILQNWNFALEGTIQGDGAGRIAWV